MSESPALRVRDLTVRYGDVRAVDGVSFDVAAGEIVALVGRSGAGKSSIALAILGLLARSAQVSGSIELHDNALRPVDGSAARETVGATEHLGLEEKRWGEIRGKQVALVPQDPFGWFNPVRTIGSQLIETVATKRGVSRHDRRELVLRSLSRSGLDTESVMGAFPHTLSGGMRQRCAIAGAISCDPWLLVADEPTTALDSTIQLQILDLLASIRDDGKALLIISHDEQVVSRLTDRVITLERGRIQLPAGSTGSVRSADRGVDRDTERGVVRGVHRATDRDAGLVIHATDEPATDSVVLRAKGLGRSFGRSFGNLQGVADADLEIARSETLAVVGESGSGKTTLLRLLTGFERADNGTVKLRVSVNVSEGPLSADPFEEELIESLDVRARAKSVQLVFQDARGSLDPRFTVGRSLAEPLRAQGVKREKMSSLIGAALRSVALDDSTTRRYPSQLSGGEVQRVAIARALVVGPEILVLDEPFSALDSETAGGIVVLLKKLQARHDLALVMATHDLGVVSDIADRVAVMYRGIIVEKGPARSVLENPVHSHTIALIAAAS